MTFGASSKRIGALGPLVATSSNATARRTSRTLCILINRDALGLRLRSALEREYEHAVGYACRNIVIDVFRHAEGA